MNGVVARSVEEELAGPSVLAPTDRQARVTSIDVLRGVALLGILIANVTSFGLPEWAYEVPLGTHLAVFTGPHAQANTVLWFARWLVMEGKMRALFSLLFGAGVILLTGRIEARGDRRAADIFLRRNMWLVAFGIVDGFFIWFGDILFFYGLTALLFLYPCRNLRVRTLMIAGIAVLVADTLVDPYGGGIAFGDMWRHRAVAAAEATRRTGHELSEAQTKALAAWAAEQKAWRPDRATIEADLAATRKGYVADQIKDVPNAIEFEKNLFYELGFGDVLGPMLIGMALLKNGFLTGKLRGRSYAWTAAIGGAISMILVGMGTFKSWSSGFDMLTSEEWLLIPYNAARMAGMLAIASVVLLAFQAGTWAWLQRRLASVGQTALSNYLLTSIVCKFVFVWGPWKLYGVVEYFQLYWIVLGVWILNLGWSPIWLRHFEFGPAEWLWRSLTYWQRQPMRRTRGAQEIST